MKLSEMSTEYLKQLQSAVYQELKRRKPKREKTQQEIREEREVIEYLDYINAERAKYF